MFESILERFRGKPARLSEGPPPWAADLSAAVDDLRNGRSASALGELQELVQKMARAQAKQLARLESLESKLEAGLAELRVAAKQPPAAPGAGAQPRRLDDVLDALDLLEEAVAAAAALPDGQALAEGLRGIVVRLDRQISQEGLTRRDPVGEPVDARLFRVVGDAQVPGLPDGVVARVVKAAVTRGDERVREGEVLVNRSSHG